MIKQVLSTQIEGIPFFKKGKVRDVYKIGDELLIVATDRISAFDVIMPNGIPDKGKILTQLSKFWFDFSKDIIKNHIISTDFDSIVSREEKLKKYEEQLRDRIMLVKKTIPLPIECVVRGYLAGSGWKEYKKTGGITGIKLPEGLLEADKLPEPIFTPSTKADIGHDENITAEQAQNIIGKETFELIMKASINLYKKCADYALSKGIIIADTKFEFGKDGSDIILIDEILTSDSSRFWPKDTYSPGGSQPSFDKQFVRDYLETLDWGKKPPAPQLPDDIINKTRDKYCQVLDMLTSKKLRNYLR